MNFQLRPSEVFQMRDDPVGSVGEFWGWAFSDFRDNTLRGVLAEYLVGKALGVDFSGLRSSWDDFDLLTPEGIRVEVKASGYLQSWESRQSSPKFTRLRGQALSTDGSSYQGEKRVRADVFVFCIQTARDEEDFDPLDLNGWKFYVLSGKQIAALDQDSISLSRIQELTDAVGFDGLQGAVKNICQEITVNQES